VLSIRPRAEFASRFEIIGSRFVAQDDDLLSLRGSSAKSFARMILVSRSKGLATSRMLHKASQ
jgi:hypothetical protein